MRKWIFVFMFLILNLIPSQTNEVGSKEILCGYVHDDQGKLVRMELCPLGRDEYVYLWCIPDAYRNHYMKLINPRWGSKGGHDCVISCEEAEYMSSCDDCGGDGKKDLQVDIWVDKGCDSTYRDGEYLTVYFKASRDCYAHVYEIMPDRSTQTLAQGRIDGDQVYTRSGTLDGLGKRVFVISAEGEEDRCTVDVEKEPSEMGAIRVYVKDDSGSYLSGVAVYLDDNYEGQTSSSGSILFEDIPKGYHTVKASKSGYKDDSERVYVDAGETETVNLVLVKEEKTGAITVYVEDGSRNELSGASIYLDGNYEGTTGTNGEYHIASVSEGYHVVKASKSGYSEDSERVYVSAGGTETAYLHLKGGEEGEAPKVKVTWHVPSKYKAGERSDLYFTICNNGGDAKGTDTLTVSGYKWDPGSWSLKSGICFLSGYNGNFYVDEKFVKNGYVEITYYVEMWNDYGSDTYKETRKIPVEGGEKEGMIIVFVLDQDNRPIKEAEIYLDSDYKGKTENNGKLTIENVESGRYKVKATKSDCGTAYEWVTVDSGETEFVSIQLECDVPEKLGAFKIFVKDKETNEWLQGVEILLDEKTAGFTDIDGYLLIKDLDPGKHHLVAQKDGYKSESKYPIAAAGKTGNIYLYMEKEKKEEHPDVIKVRVIAEDQFGYPVKDATILVEEEKIKSLFRTVKTDKNGTADFELKYEDYRDVIEKRGYIKVGLEKEDYKITVNQTLKPPFGGLEVVKFEGNDVLRPYKIEVTIEKGFEDCFKFFFFDLWINGKPEFSDKDAGETYGVTIHPRKEDEEFELEIRCRTTNYEGEYSDTYDIYTDRIGIRLFWKAKLEGGKIKLEPLPSKPMKRIGEAISIFPTLKRLMENLGSLRKSLIDFLF